MDWNHLKVTIMRKDDKNKKAKILTAIANLFIETSIKNENNSVLEDSATTARTLNASIFNFIG